MTDRRDPAATAELLARLEVAEGEINRLRDFRHSYSSDKQALGMLHDRIQQMRTEITEGRVTLATLRTDFDALEREFRLKIAEYDKERSWASRLLWPVLIALAVAAAMWLMPNLMQMGR